MASSPNTFSAEYWPGPGGITFYLATLSADLGRISVWGGLGFTISVLTEYSWGPGIVMKYLSSVI
jgi:hypothetical protein